MTWGNRLRLSGGLLFIVSLVCALTVLFNQRQSHAESSSASIESASYAVGTDFSGLVTSDLVSVGDTVKSGQAVFSIQSEQIAKQVASGSVPKTTASYRVTGTNTIQVLATAPGIVTKVSARTGTFVQYGSVLALVDRANSLFVSADYTLTPRDYARVEQGAKVDLLLPDGSTIAGVVQSVRVKTDDGAAKATVRVDSAHLVDGGDNGLMASGTPVTATLHLRSDDALSGVTDMLQTFGTKIGL